MKKEKFNENVVSIFEKSGAETLLITSDGHVFVKKYSAFCKQHCQTFNLTFVEQTKAEFISSTEKSKKADATIGFDWSALETLAQPELKSLAASLGVKAASNKGVDLLAALVEYKASTAVDTTAAPTPTEEEEGYIPAGAAPEGDETNTEVN